VSGDDALALPLIACGMSGVISVAANAFPREFSDMVRFCLQNNYPSAKNINDKLLDAYDLMFTENNPAGVKAFMAEQGLLHNSLRLPVVPLSDVPARRTFIFYLKYQEYLISECLKIVRRQAPLPILHDHCDSFFQFSHGILL
jgi:dihydrodipicolinate synthase/N-acetylneuraminate lyase